MINRLSIIIPVFNEMNTIEDVLQKVSNVQLPLSIDKEMIVVNDGSTDDTASRIDHFISKNKHNIQLISHEHNKGKGASIRSAIEHVTGDFVVIQDGDLEYDPNEYNILLKPVLDGHADVVYGSRFLGGNAHRILFFWHSLGNKFLTFLSNMFTNLNLTDMETCYKLIKTSILKDIRLVENRFGFEPEITARISKLSDIRIYEVGISYYGRQFKEGKKINWKDGIKAIYCVIRYNLFR
jgi:glycosyltransferase involved in cell wall biosynthesis